MNIKKICSDDIKFPVRLKSFIDAPKEIYYIGDLDILNLTCVAIVGSRRCTSYGKTVAKGIGQKLGENNVAVVSGMAKGIDTSSHIGALEASGKTVAVLGCGLDICFPAQNRELMKNIGEKGLLLSEYPPGFKPQPFTFPRRNRIISGISDSVVVVEAGNKSGSLITAEIAVDQGKNLYAVPGNITSHYSIGTNKLIRESVTPLIFIDDILTDLNIKPYINEEKIETMGEDEKKVYQVIRDNGETTIDEINHKTNIKPYVISGIITVLEMKGLVFSAMGKILVAKF